MAALEGQMIGSWHLQRFLGGGERGEVYLVEQLGGTTPAAMRVAELVAPNSPQVAGSSPASRFSQEAERLVALKHASVLALLEFGQQNQRGYLVMPYLPDGSLLDAFTPGKPTFRFRLPLQPATVAGLLDQVAGALHYLHGQGVVHGNVKPSNMMLAPDAQGALHIRVSDFGLAHLFMSTPSRVMSNHSVLYAAPELLQGHPVPASDQYSLGIMVYELLTGRLPFVGNDPAQVMEQQVRFPPPPPRNFNASIPQAVETILFRALSKDPAARWPTVAVFAAAYREALTSQPSAPLPQAQVAPVIPAGPAVPAPLPAQAARETSPSPLSAVPPAPQVQPLPAVQPFSALPAAPVAPAVPVVSPAAQPPWAGTPQAAPVLPPAQQAPGGQGWAAQQGGGWGNQPPAAQVFGTLASPGQAPFAGAPGSLPTPSRSRRLVLFGGGGVVALVLAVVLVVALVGGNKSASTANGGRPTSPPAGATATPPRSTPGGQGTPAGGSTPGGSGGQQMIMTDQFIPQIATTHTVSGSGPCGFTFPSSSTSEFQAGEQVMIVYTANLTADQLDLFINIDRVDNAGIALANYTPDAPTLCAGQHTYVLVFGTGGEKGPGTYKAEILCLACGTAGPDATIFFQVR